MAFNPSRFLLFSFVVCCVFASRATGYHSEHDEQDTAVSRNEVYDDTENEGPGSSSQQLLTVYEEDDKKDEVEDGDHEDDYDDEDDHDDSESENFDKIADPKQGNRALCLENECVTAAGKLVSMMNHSADPCDDFYDYVCGNFEMKHEPFADMTRTMSFEILRRENKFIIHNMLKRMSESTGIKAVDNLKSFYDSCMKLEHGGELKSIKKLIKKFGPWPMDDEKWNAKKWNFNKLLTRATTILPIAPLFTLFVTLDQKNPNQHVFELIQSGLGIPKDYYLSKDPQKIKVRQAYFKYLVNVMKLMGYKKRSQINYIKDVYLFEKELAKIFLSQTMLRQVNKVYKRMSLHQLSTINSEIEWEQLVGTMLKLADRSKNNLKYIVVKGEEYFKNLQKLLRKTKKETLANYMLLKIVSSLNFAGGQKFQDEIFFFDQVYTGQEAKKPFWATCADASDLAMPFAFGRLYVDARFKSKFAKKEVKRMVMEIKREFAANLKDVKWMSEETKKKAKEKANAIKALIAYPDYILNDQKLNKKYDGLDLKKNDYLGNILKIYMFKSKENLGYLNKKRNRGRWTSGPSVVNAFYSQTYNRIVFPAGILQPLFYHHSYPSAMKYGGIGTVIGHETTHAFDDKGRKFDKYGRLRQWWNSEDIKNFEKKANCMRQQYSSFAIDGHHMNGRLTCGENIADNGGVKMAYKAFRRHLSKHPNTKALPGLHHLTDDQLFFVSFAKIWCIIQEKARTLKNIVVDPHSYPKFRVQGTLSNNEDFAKAFNCKVGTKMNPAKKCPIW